MVRPITIAVKEIKCIEETDEIGSDEPYVLVVGVNLKPLVPISSNKGGVPPAPTKKPNVGLGLEFRF